MAREVFKGKVHIGYLAGIVAASNAGGSGSVVGDTTTTMMWIDGVSPLTVFDAYAAAVVALVICGIPARAAASLFADRQGRGAGRAHPLDARVHRVRHSRGRHPGQRHRQPACFRGCSTRSR